jgi:transcription elongation factor GreA
VDNEEILLTEAGARKLRKELEELTGPKRLDLAKRLKHAVEQGDLSENADYIAAKEEQAFLEGRIQELEAILRDATVVQKSETTDQVDIGSTVVVSHGGKEPETFEIVGAKEANSRDGKISHQSPFGRALMGKKVGEVGIAEAPSGEIKLKVLEIR